MIQIKSLKFIHVLCIFASKGAGCCFIKNPTPRHTQCEPTPNDLCQRSQCLPGCFKTDTKLRINSINQNYKVPEKQISSNSLSLHQLVPHVNTVTKTRIHLQKDSKTYIYSINYTRSCNESSVWVCTTWDWPSSISLKFLFHPGPVLLPI